MVKKVFKILGTAIICVLVLALAINVLAPNLMTIVVNVIENYIFRGTGIDMDLNGDGTSGSGATGTFEGAQSENNEAGAGTNGGDTVDGLD